MHSIPLNIPICLKAHIGNNLQNEFFFENARCNNANTEAWEQMLLLKCDDGKYIIQSRWNGKNLQVLPDGRCRFSNRNQLLWEKFDIEVDLEGYVYFISCHTGKYMQCEHNRYAYCANTVRGGWEAWRIIRPDNTDMMTASRLNEIALGTAGGVLGGVVLTPILGLTAGALVPVAMSTFGTIVPGRGTMHAPLVAGGVAAALQVTSCALLTGPAVVIGGLVGGVSAAVISSSAVEGDDSAIRTVKATEVYHHE